MLMMGNYSRRRPAGIFRKKDKRLYALPLFHGILNGLANVRATIHVAQYCWVQRTAFGSVGEIVNYCKPPICGTRRALELLRPLPFKLGRITRIGGSANYPSAGLGVNYSVGRPLTGAEQGVVGSGAEDHDQRKRLVAASAARSLEQGRLIGQKRPLKPRDVWTIRVRLQLEGRKRHLALFNLAIDSKLRGCDLVRLQTDDVCVGGRVRDRATVIQKKTGRPVQFEITEQTRAAVQDWLSSLGARSGRYLFPSRFRKRPHISTRQYARIVHGWVAGAGLDRVRNANRVRPNANATSPSG